MQNLSIGEEGFAYIFKCIGEYSGQCFYLVLYLAALVFLFLKGDKRLKTVFVYPGIIAALTVYNPLVPVLINSLFDVNQEYYRFLWISPVILAVALVLAQVVGDAAHSPARACAFFISAVLVLIASGSFVYRDGYIRAENIYKMPQEIIAVSQEIHKDSPVSFPRAVCDFDLNMQLRQYDATILLTGTREEYLNMIYGIEVDEFIAEKQKHPNRLLKVILKNEDVPREEFIESLKETGTRYVVIPRKSPIEDYLKSAGLRKIAHTGGRDIYRFESEDLKEFELADYSEVWKAQ